MKNKGISNMLSYIIIAILALIVISSVYVINFQQFNIGKSILKSEEIKGESQLKEKLSLIYYGIDGIILANDGKESININKIYVDNEVFTINEVLNSNEKKQFFIPFGENLILETSSGNLFKFERNKSIIIETSETQTSPEIKTSVISPSSSIHLKINYTSTITTTIPIQTYSYKTTTTTSYSIITITLTTTKVISYPYPYPTTIKYITTITSTFTHKYTLTFASPYTSYKTTTYTTIIDPTIEIKESNLNNIELSLTAFLLILLHSIIYLNIRRYFYE